MTVEKEIVEFYERHGFGPQIGQRSMTVRVYTGCLLVPLPNIETRHKYLKYHDLHHLVTGFSVGRIGEGQVSAWELGTGSFFANPILGVMNLIALSTGLVLQPKRMWAAFIRGCRSKNLYSKEMRRRINSSHYNSVQDIRQDILETKSTVLPIAARAMEFLFYSFLAIGIHSLIAIPAVITRFITDITLGHSFFEAVKPVKRTDLY